MSFDLEMTGISTNDSSLKYCKDDSPAIRYSKMIHIATKYSILQFGLCLFHDDGQGGLLASPYNIYLFPNSSSHDIVLSAGAIDFLRKNDMDFQKWIGTGVTFVDEQMEAKLKEKLLEDNSSKPARTPIQLSKKSDIEFMERNMNGLSDFLADSTSEIFTFEGCNGFLRRCIYEQVELRHKDEVVIKKADGNKLSVFKISKESKIEHDRLAKEAKEKECFDAIGFRHVFNDMVAAKKPVVGHNLLFDLMFTLRWLDGPLADSYEGFRERIHDLIPFIYDTKFVEWSGVLGAVQTDTALDQCFARYKPAAASDADEEHAARVAVAVSPDMREVVNLDSGNFHNAGYDAYCTGFVFAQQMAVCDALGGSIEECVNRLFLMWSLFDLDLDPTRSQEGYSCKYKGTVVRVTEFPLNITTPVVVEICQAAGFTSDKELEDLQIIWIDNFSLFISLPCDNTDKRVENLTGQMKIRVPGAASPVQLMDDFFKHGPKVVSRETEETCLSTKDSNTSVWRSALGALLAPFRWAAFGGVVEEDENVSETEEPSRKRQRGE